MKRFRRFPEFKALELKSTKEFSLEQERLLEENTARIVETLRGTSKRFWGERTGITDLPMVALTYLLVPSVMVMDTQSLEFPGTVHWLPVKPSEQMHTHLSPLTTLVPPFWQAKSAAQFAKGLLLFRFCFGTRIRKMGISTAAAIRTTTIIRTAKKTGRDNPQTFRRCLFGLVFESSVVEAYGSTFSPKGQLASRRVVGVPPIAGAGKAEIMSDMVE